jgi:Putative lumazine-binding
MERHTFHRSDTMVALLTALSSTLWAQQPNTNEAEKPVRNYLDYRNSADARKLKAALHPSMMMFWRGEDGTLNGMSSFRWVARAEAATPAKATADASQKIEFVDVEGEGGMVKTVIDNPTGGYRDYLSVLKVNGHWKVIGKIFHRREASKPGTLKNPTLEADRKAIEQVVQQQMKAMDVNDGDLLASCYHPRAMTYTVSDGELVATSIAEWAARFRSDAAAKEIVPKAMRKILLIDIENEAALAKFEHRFEDGRRYVDYASLVRLKDGWKIVGLLYLKAGA